MGLYFKKEECNWILENLCNEKDSEEHEQIAWKSEHPSSLEHCKKLAEKRLQKLLLFLSLCDPALGKGDGLKISSKGSPAV